MALQPRPSSSGKLMDGINMAHLDDVLYSLVGFIFGFVMCSSCSSFLGSLKTCRKKK